MTESRPVFAGTWGWGGHELQIGIRELSVGGWLEMFNTGSPQCVLSDHHLAKNTRLH